MSNAFVRNVAARTQACQVPNRRLDQRNSSSRLLTWSLEFSERAKTVQGLKATPENAEENKRKHGDRKVLSGRYDSSGLRRLTIRVTGNM
jgi:hypothetical protein